MRGNDGGRAGFHRPARHSSARWLGRRGGRGGGSGGHRRIVVPGVAWLAVVLVAAITPVVAVRRVRATAAALGLAVVAAGAEATAAEGQPR
jgi:hypothetical protein